MSCKLKNTCTYVIPLAPLPMWKIPVVLNFAVEGDSMSTGTVHVPIDSLYRNSCGKNSFIYSFIYCFRFTD